MLIWVSEADLQLVPITAASTLDTEVKVAQVTAGVGAASRGDSKIVPTGIADQSVTSVHMLTSSCIPTPLLDTSLEKCNWVALVTRNLLHTRAVLSMQAAAWLKTTAGTKIKVTGTFFASEVADSLDHWRFAIVAIQTLPRHGNPISCPGKHLRHEHEWVASGAFPTRGGSFGLMRLRF